MSPISNALLKAEQLTEPESYFPLRALVCHCCWLVQTLDVTAREDHFHGDYAYYSSTTRGWVEHARRFSEAIVASERLEPDSLVLEIASNDGYLLQHFKAKGMRCLGVDPAANCAAVAAERYGIHTEVGFFGRALAEKIVGEFGRADLIVANNVLAHVPDLNDFVGGMAMLLAPQGVACVEFHHLLKLIERNQFDTIYHEHYSYLSVLALEPLFARYDLTIADVEELPTHGGSLRLHIRHRAQARAASDSVERVLVAERGAGLDTLAAYSAFNDRVHATKRALLALLIALKNEGKRIAGYGAPAKGNTLLNYCGIGTDFLDYTVDRSAFKQGLYLPGSRIPIDTPERIFEDRPDFILILPWNIRDEIMEQMAGVRDWGCRFIVPIPEPAIL